MTPERDAAAAPVRTAANVHLRSTTTFYRNFITEVRPRIEFAQSLATRTALNLDGIDPGAALIAIATTLATAERWAA
jgi:hypothetical protein